MACNRRSLPVCFCLRPPSRPWSWKFIQVPTDGKYSSQHKQHYFRTCGHKKMTQSSWRVLHVTPRKTSFAQPTAHCSLCGISWHMNRLTNFPMWKRHLIEKCETCWVRTSTAHPWDSPVLPRARIQSHLHDKTISDEIIKAIKPNSRTLIRNIVPALAPIWSRREQPWRGLAAIL